jgi:hypothetical protein
LLSELLESLDDLGGLLEDLGDLPGGAELDELCQNVVFRLLCELCQQRRPRARRSSASTFDADELGLTEDL